MVVNWALPLDDRLIAGESLVVQGVREGQRDGGDRIIPVIANVRGARHDAVPVIWVICDLRRVTPLALRVAVGVAVACGTSGLAVGVGVGDGNGTFPAA